MKSKMLNFLSISAVLLMRNLENCQDPQNQGQGDLVFSKIDKKNLEQNSVTEKSFLVLFKIIRTRTKTILAQIVFRPNEGLLPCPFIGPK
jgi:hypothetical protein